MKTEKIYTQHEENKAWMNSLLFYKDELVVMKNRVGEIASRNTSKEILAKVEHFQNQLTVQGNNLDILKHEINISNDRISNEIKKNETAIDHRSIEDHSATREKMKGFTKVFTDLRSELNQFLSKTM